MEDINETTHDENRCRALWSQVLLNAVNELDSSFHNVKRNAYRFIMSDESTFKPICEIIDIDPYKTRKHVEAICERTPHIPWK